MAHSVSTLVVGNIQLQRDQAISHCRRLQQADVAAKRLILDAIGFPPVPDGMKIEYMTWEEIACAAKAQRIAVREELRQEIGK